MDYGLLLIFLCAGAWLYAAAILAFADWRWNLGRIVQSFACVLLAAWLILSHRTGPGYVQIVLLLASIAFFLPLLLQRRIHHLLQKGEARAARRWGTALSLVVWRPQAAVLSALEPIYAAAAALGGADLPALARSRASRRRISLQSSGRWLGQMLAAASRRGFIENQIHAWAVLREHRAATGLFEAHFGKGGLSPDAGLLYTIAIPYSESGDLGKAVRCLRRAEEMQGAPNPLDLRRFVAYLHVYAQTGRVYALERLLGRHPEAVALLPPAYLRLWRGVALLRHGEPEPARGIFDSVAGRETAGEGWIRRIAERYLALPPTEGVRAEPDPDLVRALEAVEALEERAPAESPLAQAAISRPVVSWGLMIACALVWLLTELFGSSEDAFTLARFGANVSGMVKAGEWWRLGSSIFVHVGLLHLLFNLYALYLFGPFIERLAGRWELFVGFVVSGFGGSAASAWLGSHGLSAGASGGIFGLLGAAIVIGLTFHDIPARIRKVYLLNFVFIAALNLAYGLFEPHIDNLAHGGGLGAGALIGLCFSPAGADGRRKRLFHVAGLLVAFVLAAALFNAVRSVEAGGYPKSVPKLETHTSEEGRWSLARPAFWQVVKKSANEVVFSDRFGAALSVAWQPGAAWIGPERGETVLKRRRLQVGNRLYHEIVVVVAEGTESMAQFRFLTADRDRSYLLVFECEEKRRSDYEGLFERILVGFETKGGPTPTSPQSPPPREA